MIDLRDGMRAELDSAINVIGECRIVLLGIKADAVKDDNFRLVGLCQVALDRIQSHNEEEDF